MTEPAYIQCKVCGEYAPYDCTFSHEGVHLQRREAILRELERLDRLVPPEERVWRRTR